MVRVIVAGLYVGFGVVLGDLHTLDGRLLHLTLLIRLVRFFYGDDHVVHGYCILHVGLGKQ